MKQLLQGVFIGLVVAWIPIFSAAAVEPPPWSSTSLKDCRSHLVSYGGVRVPPSPLFLPGVSQQDGFHIKKDKIQARSSTVPRSMLYMDCNFQLPRKLSSFRLSVPKGKIWVNRTDPREMALVAILLPGDAISVDLTSVDSWETVPSSHRSEWEYVDGGFTKAVRFPGRRNPGEYYFTLDPIDLDVTASQPVSEIRIILALRDAWDDTSFDLRFRKALRVSELR